MSTIPPPFPAQQTTPTATARVEPSIKAGQSGPPSDGLIDVRLAAPAEEAELAALLDEGHYLGADRPVGDHLRQVVTRAGRRVAILAWGPACYALKDRDLWIGWDATRRVERLSLLVQNRRFLLLAERGEAPNLASQALAAAVRALPGHWQERFGYRPLLAETFTDPEAYQGNLLQGLRVGAGRHEQGLRDPPRRFLPRTRQTQTPLAASPPMVFRPSDLND